MSTKVVAQGGEVTLDIRFYEYSGGPIIDTDVLPTYSIKDPNGTEVATSTGTKISTGYYKATYTIPVVGEISDNWSIDWTAIINGSVVLSTTENFTVVLSGSVEFSSDVLISDTWLNQIKKVIAYPLTDELLLADGQLKELCVFNALHQYFSRFPLKSYYAEQISSDSIIDFPNDNVYGVLDARIVNSGMTGSGSNSFWSTWRFNQSGAGGTGSYGIKGYNPNGLQQQRTLEMELHNSMESQYTGSNVRISESDRNISITTNKTGELNITWASYSLDFEKVKFNQQLDVIKLSQAYLLEHLSDTTSIMEDSNLSVSINSSDLKSRAEELRTEVEERWLEFPSIILLHN